MYDRMRTYLIVHTCKGCSRHLGTHGKEEVKMGMGR